MVETKALSTMDSKPQKLYQALSMNKAKKVAKELVSFVKANGLSVDIAGKDYLYTEAWQFVGETQMGLTQVVVSCDRVPAEGKEIKYKAVVEILNQNGAVLSRGFAFCSDQEKKKRSFEEYAVASMAQTRAIGKAYRNILAWIVKMAGYESTPVEEIDRDAMETTLAKAKQQVFKALNDAGITDSQEMVEEIKRVIGKSIIENIDDAMAVIAELSKDE